MSTGVPDTAVTEARIAAFDQEIAFAKAVVARIKSERAPFERAASKARWNLRQLRLKRWIRGPAGYYDLWKVGLLLTGTALVTVICLVFSDVFTDSVRTAIFTSMVGAIAAGCTFTSLLWFPRDSQLTAAIVDAEIESKAADTQVANQRATDGLQDQLSRLKELMGERCGKLRKLRAELTSEMRQRRLLFQQDWRAIRDYEWEEFLVRVFRALGAKAHRIGGAGDQGVDLIVEIGPRRIAVQAKGYLNPVSNKAIQEAYAGKAHHRCTDCAVITNSRFTQGAHVIAVSTGCILIGEDEFPDLVIGNIKLLELAQANRN